MVIAGNVENPIIAFFSQPFPTICD